MNEPAFIFLAKNSQLAHCGHIGKISLFMMRLAIIRHGQGGTINDHIRLNLLKKTLNVRFIPYICFMKRYFPTSFGEISGCREHPVTLYCA